MNLTAHCHNQYRQKNNGCGNQKIIYKYIPVNLRSQSYDYPDCQCPSPLFHACIFSIFLINIQCIYLPFSSSSILPFPNAVKSPESGQQIRQDAPKFREAPLQHPDHLPSPSSQNVPADKRFCSY